MVDTPVDEFGEHLPVGERAVGVVGHLPAAFGADVPVTVFLDAVLVVLGDAEQHAHHAQRHDRAEILDEVEAIAADQRVQAPLGELADHGLERVDLAWREGPRRAGCGGCRGSGGLRRSACPEGISMSDLMISSTTPRAELKDWWSTSARLTSSNRLSA